MREQFQEIFATIKRNKLRTFLTGFSVAWGIFMLIILLGSGNGLKHGITDNFSDGALNTITLYGGYASMPYQGFQNGRRIRLNERDMEILKTTFSNQIKDITALAYHGNSQMAYGKEYYSTNLYGVTSEFAPIDGITLTSGRFINETDVKERRKVVVLDKLATTTLFKDEDPVGKTVLIDKMGYTVVGTYKSNEYFQSSNVYVPLTTMFLIYMGDKREVNNIAFTVEEIETTEQSDAFKEKIRARLGAAHSFNPEDRQAMWINDRMENYKDTMLIFRGITIFIWIIGIGTLIAGIVGVSNIMLVTVRERTFEFGIRKAMGAKPVSLIKLVLLESILITGTFGYIGMIGGVGIMEIVNLFVERAAAASPDDFQMFKNPTLDLSTMLSATLVLVIAGMIAGYVPARRAAQIKTIDAMRHNK